MLYLILESAPINSPDFPLSTGTKNGPFTRAAAGDGRRGVGEAEGAGLKKPLAEDGDRQVVF